MKKILLEKRVEEITALHLLAFGEEEGPMVSQLAKDFLLREDSVSFSFEEDGKIVGNVIFSPFKIEEYPEKIYYLLAPIAVSPNIQAKGMGKELIKLGGEHLKSLGAEAIFVLGYPEYYPRAGFVPTSVKSPYFDVMNSPEAWMVLELEKGCIQGIQGQGVASEPIMKKFFWDTSIHH